MHLCIFSVSRPQYSSSAPHFTAVNRLASHHVLPVFSHLQEALHSSTPTLSYRLRHWEISHTGVFCTFFFTVTANSVTGFSLDRIEIVCFNYSQLASLTNGCLCVSLLLNFSALKHQKQDHTMCRSFGVKHCARFESHLRSDQTSSDCCRRRKKSPTAKSSCQNK